MDDGKLNSESPDVRISIVSDVVCPWCIVGYKQLEEALSRLDGKVVAEHDLAPDTKTLSLMQLEDLVQTAPFDE